MISPPTYRAKYGINTINSFLGATSVQATEPKRWVLKHSYPLINVARQSIRTENYFKKTLYECSAHSTIIAGFLNLTSLQAVDTNVISLKYINIAGEIALKFI